MTDQREPRFVFHIAFESDWLSAASEGAYEVSTRGATLSETGFIHASYEHQVERIGSTLYRDVDEPLLVLVIDTRQLVVPVVAENLEGGHELFPHIYGPLPRGAVVEVRHARSSEEGFVIEATGGF